MISPRQIGDRLTGVGKTVFGLNDGNNLMGVFAAGVAWSLTGAVASRGLNLVGSVIAGHSLGAKCFGELGMVQSTIGIFGILAGMGMSLTAAKHVPEWRSAGPAQTARGLTSCIHLALGSGVLASVLLLSASGPIAVHLLSAPDLAPAIRIATGLVLFGAFNGVQTGILTGFESFRSVAVASSIVALVRFVGLVLGSARWGVSGAVGGLVCAEGIACLINYWLVRQVVREAGCGLKYAQLDRSQTQSILRFALPALLSSLSTLPAMWCTNVMLVNQRDGYVAMGIFNAADKWRQLLVFFPSTLSPVILPMLSRLHVAHDSTGYRKLISLNLGLSLAAVLIPSALLVVLSRSAMAAYGASYSAGSTTLMILCAVSVGTVVNNVLGQVLVSRGAMWYRFCLDVVLAVTLLLSSLWLIPRYAQTGLALAYLVSFAVTCALLGIVCSSGLNTWRR